jgi:hypothetical protein
MSWRGWWTGVLVAKCTRGGICGESGIRGESAGAWPESSLSGKLKNNYESSTGMQNQSPGHTNLLCQPIGLSSHTHAWAVRASQV